MSMKYTYTPWITSNWLISQKICFNFQVEIITPLGVVVFPWGGVVVWRPVVCRPVFLVVLPFFELVRGILVVLFDVELIFVAFEEGGVLDVLPLGVVDFALSTAKIIPDLGREKNERQRKKTYRMIGAIRVSLRILAVMRAPSEDGSDYVDLHADLSLRRVLML